MYALSLKYNSIYTYVVHFRFLDPIHVFQISMDQAMSIFFSMQTLSLPYKLHVEYFFNVCYETIGDLFDILVLRVLPPNQPPCYDGRLIFMWKMPKTKRHMDIHQASQYLRGNRDFFRDLCRDGAQRMLSSVQIYSGPWIIAECKLMSLRTVKSLF